MSSSVTYSSVVVYMFGYLYSLLYYTYFMCILSLFFVCTSDTPFFISVYYYSHQLVLALTLL